MTGEVILVVVGAFVGFLMGMAAMLLLREPAGAGRIWSQDARPSPPEEDLGRTDRQGGSDDTHAQRELPLQQGTGSGRTQPLPITTRRGSPVAMLTARGGIQEGHTWLLRYAASTTIGRFDDCDIAINDHGVSRLHAQITHRTDAATAHEFAIFDYSSTNGTMVNGQPINAVASLQDGDLIHIGNTQFEFRRVRQEGAESGG